MRNACKLFAASALLVISVETAQAQDSRAALIEKEQAAKAQAVQPYEPGKIEKLLAYIDRNDLFTRLADGDGFPVIGGITTGGGLAFRGGYRRHVADYRGLFDASAAISIKGYWQAGLEVAFPELFGRRLRCRRLQYRSFPQEDFYGVGFDNTEADRVNYSIEGFDYSGLAVFRPSPWLGVGMRLGLMSTDLGAGTDTRFPSIEQVFNDASAPGLTVQPDFLYRELMAEVDTRDEPGNPRSGGFYRIAWIRYGDRDADQFSFSRITAEAGHLFPVFDKKRVFLVRGRLIASDPDEGEVVPFYMMPTLGGSYTSQREQLPLSRQQSHALQCRVSLGGLVDSGHGCVRRRRESRGRQGGHRSERTEARIRAGLPVQHASRRIVSPRPRVRRRGVSTQFQLLGAVQGPRALAHRYSRAPTEKGSLG